MTDEPKGCPTPGACSALTEIERLQTAINEAYAIMCTGIAYHSARELDACRILRVAGITIKDQ